MASNAGEDVVLAEDEDGMKASAVPNQTLVSHCSLVTLWYGVLVVIVTYTARQLREAPPDAEVTGLLGSSSSILWSYGDPQVVGDLGCGAGPPEPHHGLPNLSLGPQWLSSILSTTGQVCNGTIF